MGFLNVVRDLINTVISDKNELSYLGSGQFAFVVSNSSRLKVEQMLIQIKQVFVEDLLIEGYRVHCDMRAGYSSYPDSGSQPEALLKAASIALFQAKKKQQTGTWVMTTV